MLPPSHRTRYAAYLLRIWQDGASEPWRASLEDVRTGRRISFGSPRALFDHLAAAMQPASLEPLEAPDES